MLIHNTTNIPSVLLREITKVVSEPLGFSEFSYLQVRNKQEGAKHGNWGYYYSMDDKCTLCVPNIIQNYRSFSPFSKSERIINDKLEWLALVIGHEARHKWQHLNEPSLFKYRSRAARNWCEVDAELYEKTAIKLWREYCNYIEKAATNAGE